MISLGNHCFSFSHTEVNRNYEIIFLFYFQKMSKKYQKKEDRQKTSFSTSSKLSITNIDFLNWAPTTIS